MTEPTPTPPPATREVRLISWPRVRVYGWSILLVLAIWFYAVVVLIWEQPKRIVDYVLAQLPFPASTGRVVWLDRHTLEIDDEKLGDFFYAQKIIVHVKWRRVLRRHVALMQVTGAQLFTGPLDDALKKFKRTTGLNWTIDRLEISRGTVLLGNLIPDSPPVAVRLGISRPLVLEYLHLNRPDKSPSMTKERTIEIESVVISSPFDPLSPVLAFPLTRVRFSYNELWHHKIREVAFVRPTMFLGQDLFWFTDQFKKERTTQPSEGVRAPWTVDHLEVQYGQLAVNAFGQPAVRFPFFFETKVDNIRLDQLDKISAKSTIAILRLDQEYPDYKIRIMNLSGKIEFSVPPTDSTANNVVPTIHIDELAWDDIPATNVWASVTFDPSGIYGQLGGDCEGGYMKGNFEVYYTKGFLWNAELFADKLNCAPVTEKLGGKYLSLTGTLDGKIDVDGKATKILSCEGTLDLAQPGTLVIKSLDDLLKYMPANATAMKQSFTKIAVQAFRTYPYQNGQFKVNYTPDGGQASLKLNSPSGQREVDILLHPYDSSKVAKAGDNQ